MTQATTDALEGFGELLRRHRLAAGLSQDELAERAGLSAHGISDLERGARRSPYPQTVHRLATALALSATDTAALRTASRRRTSVDTTERTHWPASELSVVGAPWQPARSTVARRHNLPAPRMQLIGREQHSAMVRDLVLRVPERLVTLTGPGGCGKTQLALHVASHLVDTFADGVWLVELGPIQDGHLVPYALTNLLGCGEHARGTIIETLVAYLAGRELLLVLDNCEHLVDACADLADRVLSDCPRVKFLATSREHLRVAGEVVWRVPSLAAPDLGRTTHLDELAFPRYSCLCSARGRSNGGSSSHPRTRTPWPRFALSWMACRWHWSSRQPGCAS